MASAQPAADAKGVRLVKVLGSAAIVQGDPGRLQQVVWNLVSNAIKFTPRGGLVQVTLRKVNSHIHMQVSDSGQGIRADLLPHVFERFRQGDASATRRHGGLGLGLAIVKNLVEMHGGSVEAASEGDGLGSVFTVRLPLALAAAQSRAARRYAGVRRPWTYDDLLDGLRVLVLDDEADARDVVQRLLEDAGAQVRTVGTAAEALTILEGGFVPDIILSDIGMPDQDGYDFMRQVRSLEGAVAEVPGGGTDGARARRGSQAGADGGLPDPPRQTGRPERARGDGREPHRTHRTALDSEGLRPSDSPTGSSRGPQRPRRSPGSLALARSRCSWDDLQPARSRASQAVWTRGRKTSATVCRNADVSIGLQAVTVVAGGERSASILGTRVGADGERGNTPAGLTNPRDELVAVDVRHGDVGDDELDRPVCRLCQRLQRAIGRVTLQDLGTTSGEQRGEQIARIALIVHDEDHERRGEANSERPADELPQSARRAGAARCLLAAASGQWCRGRDPRSARRSRPHAAR